MRILALVTEAFGGRGGIARFNRHLLSALGGATHVDEVTVLPRYRDEDRAAEAPANVTQLQPRPGKLGYTAAALSLVLRNRHFDVVFCGHLYSLPLAALIGRLLGRPVWLHLHGIEAWTFPGTAISRAMKPVGLVTAVSRHTRRRFLGWAGIEPDRVKVLPNTVDPRFRPGPKSDELAQRLGVEDRRVLLTVSRLSSQERYKGHDRVIAVLPQLLRDLPDLVYVVAGEGDDRPRLEALARDMGVAGAVKFTGRVADEELPDLYRLAELFVMPSTGEGFGIVFLEALASATPVVGGGRDGSVDPLRDGAAGELVEPGDARSLLGALRRRLNRNSAEVPGAMPFDQQRFDVLVHKLVQYGWS